MLFTFSQVNAYPIPNCPSPHYTFGSPIPLKTFMNSILLPALCISWYTWIVPSIISTTSFEKLVLKESVLNTQGPDHNSSCRHWDSKVTLLVRSEARLKSRSEANNQLLNYIVYYVYHSLSLYLYLTLFYFICVEVSIVIVFLFISFLFLTVLTLHIFVTKQFGIEQFINVIMSLWIIPIIYIKQLLSY